MFYTVYKITNLVDGKVYIGKHQTEQLKDGYMGSGKYLQHAIKKHGLENFKKEILYQFDNEEEMNHIEAELVTEEFCKRDDTYNICIGGKGGWSYINSNRNFSEHNMKLAKNRDYSKTDLSFVTDEWRKNKSDTVKKLHKKGIYHNFSFLDRNHTEKAKKKIGQANSKLQKGSKNSQYGTIWITNEKDSTKIKKDDMIPEGWRRGRIFNNGRKPRL